VHLRGCNDVSRASVSTWSPPCFVAAAGGGFRILEDRAQVSSITHAAVSEMSEAEDAPVELECHCPDVFWASEPVA
jgi:hypothetical protein